ncbi:MAG: rod shape-determining protein MreC [Bacteroidota bacterium]
MKYLFLFLKKQFFFLLFVFLELIAFLLLANHTNYHRTSILNTTNAVTGSFYSGFSSVSDYFYLLETNNQLSLENAQLRSVGSRMLLPPDSLFYTDTVYNYIPAKVVSNTNRNRNNYIMINKGRSDGIGEEMGLISPTGIAGIVVEVSNHYATAISILHKNTRISARMKRNGQMVNVVWDGVDYRKGLVEDIPTHIIPRAGDTIITSGYSFVFPENILIGVIGEKFITGGTLNKAEVIFSTDFNNLSFVYVTKNITSEELDSLDIKLIDE